MNGQLGKQFLKDYVTKTHLAYSKILDAETQKAKAIGEVPYLSMKLFSEMAMDGKGIRGALVVLSYLACGGKDLEEIYKTSLFIEIFHAGILVHDDFMDNDSFRRGHKAIHKCFEEEGARLNVKGALSHYGNGIAVMIGDVSFYLSWSILIESNFAQTLKIEVAKYYSKQITRLAFGQMMDVTITGAKDILEKDILEVIWIKSGEYTSLLPIMVGAMLAGEGAGGSEDLEGYGSLVSDKRLTALKNYAKCFGWAFHIQDDYLGLFADETELGKPVGSDLRESKNTLFVNHLKKHGDASQLAFFNTVFGKFDITPDDVDKVREILRKVGSVDYVLELGWKYVEEGKKYIKEITDDVKLQEIFESLLVFMMERTK